MRSESRILQADVARTDLEPEPITPADVLDGDPVARSVKLTESANGRVTSHIWDCTAGSFRWHYNCHEVIHILEGEALIEDDAGNSFVITAGDVIQFTFGSSAQWTVPTYIRKVAFLSTPHSAVLFAKRLRRVPAKLRRLLAR